MNIAFNSVKEIHCYNQTEMFAQVRLRAEPKHGKAAPTPATPTQTANETLSRKAIFLLALRLDVLY